MISTGRRMTGSLALAATLLASAGAAHASSLSGTVKAGGKPLAGAQVELRQAGPTASTVLASGRSGKGGAFTLGYEADAAGGPLYVLSDGGRGTPGDRVRLMTVAGDPASPPTQVVVSEQTTVASGYSLAQFLHGRSVHGPEPGLSNAAATAANLMEAPTGKVSFVLASSPNGNATETLAKFNTIANALASCTRGSRPDCGRVLKATRIPGAEQPPNTLGAIRDLARFPGHSTRSLFRLQDEGSAPFGPALSRRPSDWTISLVYVGSGLNAPGRMAFDAAGNSWTVNNFQTPGTGPGLELTALSPTGQPVFGSPIGGGGIKGAGWGVAIDSGGSVFVANFGGDSISEVAPDGTVLSPASGYVQGGMNDPQGLAVDQADNLWIANFGGDSVVVYRGGDPGSAEVVPADVPNPFSLAIDGDGSAWVTSGAESDRGSVFKIANDGTVLDEITGGGLRSPQGISEDFEGNFWVSNLLSDSVTRIKPSGKIAKGSPIRVKSIGGPWGNAVDGDGNLWVAGFHDPAITLLCGAASRTCPGDRRTGDPISPARHGYASEGLQHVTAVQVDPSGNVWAANNWTTGSPLSQFVGGNGLVEFIGAAPPVATPLIGPPQRP